MVGRVKGGGETANRELSRCEEVFSDIQTKTLDVILVAVDIASHGLQLWNLLRDGVLIDIQCERAKDLRGKTFAETSACEAEGFECSDIQLSRDVSNQA